MIKSRFGLRVAVVALGMLAGSAGALAGPPMICFPFDNGGAKSLPWGDDAFSKIGSYDRANLVKDTLELLKTERSTLARMETLRRAAIYCDRDGRMATELLAKLSWIAMDAEAAGKPSAEAWFNPGFFAAAATQLGVEFNWKPGVAQNAVGYAWIKKSLELDPDNGEVHFAAALAVFERGDGRGEDVYKAHVRKALAKAEPGSALAKSMESNLALGGKKVDELRKELGVADAGKR